MTRLSVNINKIATIRNARGGNMPDLIQVAKDCERFGAEGITVHPRPDERHITYQDVKELKPIVRTEFNIEGNPNEKWMKLVLEHQPDQATLVPDKPNAITSNAGYNTIEQADDLRPLVKRLQDADIRVSIFIDPDPEMAEGAAKLKADRVELYTGPYAAQFLENKNEAIRPYVETAKAAYRLGLGVNAGHDLSLENLQFFAKKMPNLLEVSIGHALISDSIYLGLENTIQMYKRCLV